MKINIDKNETWLSRPPTNDDLTEFETMALGMMPVDEWFKAFDLPYQIRRPEATCERLHLKGYLEKSFAKDPRNIADWIYKLAINDKEYNSPEDAAKQTQERNEIT